MLPGLVGLPVAYELAILFLLGLFLGSFFSVVTTRLPEGGSIVYPGSRCPACGAPIRWYDNIPLLSFVLLGGRCRSCRRPIPLFYPLIELTTALTLGLTWYFAWRMGWGLIQALVVVLIAALLLLIAVIDQRTMLIPDHLSFPLVLVALLFGLSPLNPLFPPTVHWQNLLWGLGAGAVIFVISALGAMGQGDALLALAMGFLLGPHILVAMFLALMGGGLVALGLFLYLRMSRRPTRGAKMAFGPWLCLATWVALFFAPPLEEWYLTSFLG